MVKNNKMMIHFWNIIIFPVSIIHREKLQTERVAELFQVIHSFYFPFFNTYFTPSRKEYIHNLPPPASWGLREFVISTFVGYFLRSNSNMRVPKIWLLKLYREVNCGMCTSDIENAYFTQLLLTKELTILCEGLNSSPQQYNRQFLKLWKVLTSRVLSFTNLCLGRHFCWLSFNWSINVIFFITSNF